MVEALTALSSMGLFNVVLTVALCAIVFKGAVSFYDWLKDRFKKSVKKED